MWSRIKELKYLSIAKCYFTGIVLAVFVFQFTTESTNNLKFDFSSLIGKEIAVYLISTLIGALVGGMVFVIMVVNKKEMQIREKDFWMNLKAKNTSFFIRNMIAFSLGGFVFKLITNIFNLNSYDNIFETLFSKDFVIEYVGVIFAMCVFSILLSVGIKKRLNLLYG